MAYNFQDFYVLSLRSSRLMNHRIASFKFFLTQQVIIHFGIFVNKEAVKNDALENAIRKYDKASRIRTTMICWLYVQSISSFIYSLVRQHKFGLMV